MSTNKKTIPVVVSGTVADVAGNRIANLPVDIFSDSTFIFSYNNQVLTDANGFYGDTIDYPLNLDFGILAVEATDCDGSTIGVVIEFEMPGYPSIDDINNHVEELLTNNKLESKTTTRNV